MKYLKIILAIVGILGFVVLNFGNKTTVAKTELDLMKLSSILQNEDILIIEWSLHARENMENLQSVDEVKKYTKNLMKQYPNWTWTSNDSGENSETVAVLNKNSHTETLKILSTPTKNKVQTYVIYEVKGNSWKAESEKEINSLLNGRISDIFHKNTTIFSCLKGEFNGKIDKTLPDEINQLLTAFDAKKIEGLHEENFISASAYSTLFDNTLQTKGKDMNLQIGIRNHGLGGKTTLVVGTPILTIEY
ncbi:YwmB family TATA-box binding protein [Bacillus sp. FJAT-29937]|uniref:YwmB family TATA-box binding protein n=1 Tax=Bacillus sp. FJAT-29937 TaxID=1720553 RepID=UPI000832FFDB|nr:YwmB family TATA-box binding protein [Bacillus sp. FJAT-29937]